MLEFQKNENVTPLEFSKCHDGIGTLICKSLIGGFESERFSLFHSDDIPAGVTIGLHRHERSEEIYYLVSGKGILQYDDHEYEMNPGDISVCKGKHNTDHFFSGPYLALFLIEGQKRMNFFNKFILQYYTI